jgi:hypothetical protein
MGEMRIGIVEWNTGTSTVYLGFYDFSVPVGAYATAGVFCAICFVAITIATWLLRKRGWNKGVVIHGDGKEIN